jgi:hypothetical protein
MFCYNSSPLTSGIEAQNVFVQRHWESLGGKKYQAALELF